MIGLLLRLPYETRVSVTGWVAGRLIAPLKPMKGMREQIRANLAHVFPDMPRAEVERLCRAVPGNFARSFIEMFSGAEFTRRAAATPIEGPGYAAVLEAHQAGRPVILVTGHIGSADAVRAALTSRGLPVGLLYQPMKQQKLNRRYTAALEATGKPIFPRSRTGMAEMIRFLRKGGILGMVIDQAENLGLIELDFLGKPARTPLSAAEIALKYGALLVPVYGLRQPDGLSFRIVIEAPIPHGDPRAMTQAFNDSLGAQIRANMDQWLWTYPRWRRD